MQRSRGRSEPDTVPRSRNSKDASAARMGRMKGNIVEGKVRLRALLVLEINLVLTE